MSRHHALDYVELGTSDLPATTRFLADVLGWTFTEYGPTYAAIQSPDRDGEVGGIDAGTTPTDGGPLVLVFSDDLDATVAAVEAGGGTVVEAPYAFPGGRRFHFRVPGGAVLGAWSPR